MVNLKRLNNLKKSFLVRYDHSNLALSLRKKISETQNNFYGRETFIHETAVIDEPCSIGVGSKIWHFSHIMKDAVLGNDCNLGQNVVISPRVTLGNNVKVQNNVSIYTGVICEDDVFLGPQWFLQTLLILEVQL